MNWNLSFLALPFILAANTAFSQYSFSGKVISGKDYIVGATVLAQKQVVITDTLGCFNFTKITENEIIVKVTSVGFEPFVKKIKIQDLKKELIIELIPAENNLESVVISGSMKEVSKSESAIVVDIIKPEVFKKNASPNFFEAIQMVSGVRPQVNCSICNTGDIHINGMEGPYTAVLIDGMPIVSALSTVYGLMGIPTGLIERLEVVKGPSSTLYGTEAVAGLINIITKSPLKSPGFWLETNVNSWGESALDLGFSKKYKTIFLLSGVSIFGFDQIIDKNHDGFTDLSLQKRISWFNKLNYGKKNVGSLAARLLYENRWGGQTHWNESFRGTDSVYGESIKTLRWELIGKNKLSKKIDLNYSFISHRQDSYYGTLSFQAKQDIAFAQALYRIEKSDRSILIGLPLKYTYYDDNTVATKSKDCTNMPQTIFNPAVFVQYERDITVKLKFLAAWRTDYFSNKKWVQSPRLALKLKSLNQLNILRLNYGNGFRWVNVFSEDHASLTGARKVIISEDLKPEKSHNLSLNLEKKIPLPHAFIGIESTIFYSYFSNKIMPDYDSHPEKIFYRNLSGFLDSKGLSLSLEFSHQNGLKFNTSASLLDMRSHTGGSWIRPVLTETASGSGSISYRIKRWTTSLDYTYNWLSPMRLPLQGKLDPRPEYSPITHIHNFQVTKYTKSKFEFFVGIKNLFNFLPYRGLPFLIANASDPFDKNVAYNSNGEVLQTPKNPFGLTFDPSYVYTSLQGIRLFGGFRMSWK